MVCVAPTSSRRSATRSARLIPNNYGLVREAIDRGVPLDEIKPGNKITVELKKLILPQGDGKSANEPTAVGKKFKLLAGAVRRVRHGRPFFSTPHRRPGPRTGAKSPRSTDVSWTVFPEAAAAEPAAPAAANPLLTDKLLDAKVRLHRRLIEEINLSALEKLPEEDIRNHIQQLVSQYVLVERLALNTQELSDFVSEILDEMTGLGPA